MPEDEGVVDGDLASDAVVHGVDVRLVHRHALLGQARRVVDGDVLQLRVERPVLVWWGRCTLLDKTRTKQKEISLCSINVSVCPITNYQKLNIECN